MTCARCGLKLFGPDLATGVHGFHEVEEAARWATDNRIACDFFHRGIVRDRS